MDTLQHRLSWKLYVRLWTMFTLGDELSIILPALPVLLPYNYSFDCCLS